MTEKLPPGWEKTKLSTICDLIRGITFPASEKEEHESASNISCLRTTNVQNEIVWDNVYFVPKIFVKKDAQIVREGDILMSMANSYELVGKTALVKNLPMNATFGAFLAAIRPKNKVNNRYIFYQLRTEQAQNALRMGSSQTVNIANISHQKLNELEILVAPPDEQKRIVARLDRLLARVDSCRAHLDRAAAAIKRFRQSVLNNLITPSDRCKRVNLSDVCKSIADGDHQAPPKSETGIPFLVISNLMSGKVDLQSVTRYVPETYYNSLNVNRSPQKNDILYTVTGSYGKAVLVENDAKFCFQRHIAILKPDPAKVDHTFLLYQLNSPQILNQANETATGVAQLTVPLKKLREFKVELPSLKEQKLIARKISTLFNYADQFESRLTAARERVDNLTASILAKAFRGELVAASSVTKKKTETSAAF